MNSDSSFVISPMTKRIELNAGEVYHGTLSISNPQNATNDFKFKVSVSAYSVSGDDYSADFLTENDRTLITNWITLDKDSGTLKPNETTKINYTITVPENAPGGGQYAALLVTSDTDVGNTDGIAVENVFEMASLIFAKIQGETEHGGEIKENNIPGFVTELPIRVDAFVSNSGNVHDIARVEVEVRSVFSAEPIYPKSYENNTIEETIMPETSRRIIRDLDGFSPLGIYTVKQTITYLDEVSVIEKTVIACPIWFMVLLSVTVIAIVYSIFKSLKRHRRRKQMFKD